MRSAHSIAFDFRPSRSVGAATVAVSLAAAVAPWQSALPASARIVLSLSVGLAGAISLRRFYGMPIRRIAYRALGWMLIDENATEHLVELVAHVRIGPWLALTFRDSGSRMLRALLGPDNLDPETRRRLAVLLSRGEVVQSG
jgi:hypothetical protein